MTISNSTLSSNNANDGGAIYNFGNANLNVSGTTFVNNVGTGPSGSGAAILHSTGTLTITNCTFSNNGAEDRGAITTGGGGSATISGSTFVNNGVSINGGAIWNDGQLSITDSTFSGNQGGEGGGAIWNASGTLTVTDSTISGNITNAAGAGIYVNGGTGMWQTRRSDNNSFNGSITAGANCVGVSNGGYNIPDDGTCGFGTSTGAKGQTVGDNVDPLSSGGGLQNNGGPTQTIALAPGSPAIAAVPLANCGVTTDQRGDPRPAPGYSACDIGAYEFQGMVVNTLQDDSTSGDGHCSLRKAIDNANSPGVDTTDGDCATGTGNDTIYFSVSGTITLTGNTPGVQNALTIDGSGQTITLDGAGSYQVLGNQPRYFDAERGESHHRRWRCIRRTGTASCRRDKCRNRQHA